MLSNSTDEMENDISQIPILLGLSNSAPNADDIIKVRSINTYIYASSNPVNYIDPLGLKDYLDKCKGRYLQCGNGQSKDNSTLTNWLSWKICKKAVDKSCSVGFPSCCDSEYKMCMKKAGTDEKKMAICGMKQEQCVAKGR